MTPATWTAPGAPGETLQRRGQLALTMQEAFTAAVRLRANRQVAANADAFRAQMKQLLSSADQEGRRLGYAGDDVKLGIYAFIVFLDESVLNSSQPMFAQWPLKPLQEEVFGGHMGGEIFYQNLQGLLARPDSEDLADLLEVHWLCLLLGFKGRYSADPGQLKSLTAALAEKIMRIRGGFGELSPSWAPPSGERVPAAKDPWIPRLGIAAATLAVIAILLFIVFRLTLRAGVSDLQSIGSQIIG